VIHWTTAAALGATAVVFIPPWVPPTSFLLLTAGLLVVMVVRILRGT
jgi:hypothetical protein